MPIKTTIFKSTPYNGSYYDPDFGTAGGCTAIHWNSTIAENNVSSIYTRTVDTAAGDLFTINRKGIYVVSFFATPSITTGHYHYRYISRNAAYNSDHQLAYDKMLSLTTVEETGTGGGRSYCEYIGTLNINDVVRFHMIPLDSFTAGNETYNFCRIELLFEQS